MAAACVVGVGPGRQTARRLSQGGKRSSVAECRRGGIRYRKRLFTAIPGGVCGLPESTMRKSDEAICQLDPDLTKDGSNN